MDIFVTVALVLLGLAMCLILYVALIVLLILGLIAAIRLTWNIIKEEL